MAKKSRPATISELNQTIYEICEMIASGTKLAYKSVDRESERQHEIHMKMVAWVREIGLRTKALEAKVAALQNAESDTQPERPPIAPSRDGPLGNAVDVDAVAVASCRYKRHPQGIT